ncbi:hypothetical protein EDD53_0950 [Pacificibacter maritimus]|uniref:Uncharacterized protein n=1 Tax=Pacificibacter maritimus TaxID=762213 RepID=A0A3N4VD83_9RHOB|nr:hypothetical protein [Pacificibacter maritimus]RPE71820.1 hypothetical protein EDD53_0950 [Pacificibacter maritimus]
MDDRRRTPLYLARASYRRRRLIDAQRLLPIFLFLLYLIPLLWGDEATNTPVGDGARGYVHVFSVWFGAIVIAGLITRALRREDRRHETDQTIDQTPAVDFENGS